MVEITQPLIAQHRFSSVGVRMEKAENPKEFINLILIYTQIMANIKPEIYQLIRIVIVKMNTEYTANVNKFINVIMHHLQNILMQEQVPAKSIAV